MKKNKNFKLHQIWHDNFQIIGDVTGIAIKRFEQNNYFYQIKCSFDINNSLIKLEMNPNDHTVHNQTDIINRINTMIEREKNQSITKNHMLKKGEIKNGITKKRTI